LSRAYSEVFVVLIVPRSISAARTRQIRELRGRNLLAA
jgi:hypothetical protein